MSCADDKLPDDSWEELGASADHMLQPSAATALDNAPHSEAVNRSRERAAELWEWRQPTLADLKYFQYELLCLLFIVLYLVNRTRGSRANEGIALAWAREFVTKGRVLERNFALCGPGAAFL